MDREKGTPVGTKIISIISPSVIIIIIIIIKPCVYTRPTVGGKRKTLELELEILLFHFFFVLILFHGETHDHDDPVGSKLRF